mmetsp:Transcript_15997/g.18989  ORF Transcript_15997/g.18989 Transcript_15997/m.18989 type:complete len:92 (+) Transcript_15997:1357-1632(+)
MFLGVPPAEQVSHLVHDFDGVGIYEPTVFFKAEPETDGSVFGCKGLFSLLWISFRVGDVFENGKLFLDNFLLLCLLLDLFKILSAEKVLVS